MNLYCWPHNTVHDFTPDNVEQIVYALIAELEDAEKSAPTQDPNAHPTMICPQQALFLAREPEAYLEHVEQGVECRRDLTPPTAPAAVTVRWVNDDTVAIDVNGKQVAAANNDDHGWSGMDAVINTATAVARAFGGDVPSEGIPNL